MRFDARRRKSRLLPVDMTPMIDIVFQLLIFFLTTAQLAQFSRAEMDLPEEAGEQVETAEGRNSGSLEAACALLTALICLSVDTILLHVR